MNTVSDTRYSVRGEKVVIINNSEIHNFKMSGSSEQTKTSFDGPDIPKYFLKRKNHHNSLVELFNCNDLNSAKLKIVFGVSGSGKTTIVADFYKESRLHAHIGGMWVDCRQHYQIPEQLHEQGTSSTLPSVIVFDNLDSEHHPAIEEDWLRFFRSSSDILIITTTNQTVVENILSIFSLSNTEGFVEKIEPFDKNEANQFLEGSVRVSSIEQIDLNALVEVSNGSPVVLQLMSDLVRRGGDIAQFEGNLRDFSIEKLTSEILTMWLFSCSGKGSAEKILTILACIPFFGMSLESLSFLIGRSDIETWSSLEQLNKLGLAMIRGHQGKNGEVNVSICEAIRELSIFQDSFDEDELWSTRRKYISYLRDKIERDGDCDTGTYLDAWVSGWSWIFQDQRYANKDLEAFDKGSEEYFDMLPKIIERGRSWNRAPEIKEFLRPKISSDMPCQMLTGLAHVLRDLPEDYSIADMMWEASRNYDRWGRASAIGVSVSHWKRLGLAAKTGGANHILAWFEFAMSKCEETDPDWIPVSNSNLLSPGFDLMVALGGLCQLQAMNKAEEILFSARYESAFGSCWMPLIMIVTRFCDEKKLNSSGKYHDFVVRKLLARMPNDFEPTVLRIVDYWLSTGLLNKKIDQEIRRYRESFLFKTRDATLAMDVANYSDSTGLRLFVYLNEDDSKLHF